MEGVGGWGGWSGDDEVLLLIFEGGGGGVGTRFELKVKDHGVMKTCRGDEMS